MIRFMAVKGGTPANESAIRPRQAGGESLESFATAVDCNPI